MYINMQILTVSAHAVTKKLIPESSYIPFHDATKVSQKLLIRTVYTCVLVLAIAYFGRLGAQGLCIAALW